MLLRVRTGVTAETMKLGVDGRKEILLKGPESPKLIGGRKRGSWLGGTKKTMMLSYGEWLQEFRSAPGALAQKKLLIQKVADSNRVTVIVVLVTSQLEHRFAHGLAGERMRHHLIC